MLNFFTGSIARRLYGLLCLFALGFIGIVGYQLLTLRSNLEDFKKTEIQSVVMAGANLAQSYYERALKGEMTMEQAQTQAKEALRQMRYQESGYLFIDSFDYVNIMHSEKPKKEGTDRSKEVDGNGKLYLKEMIDNAKANGSAYESYLWTSTTNEMFDKVTYAQAFKPFGWVIASGVLLTDVQAIFFKSALTSGLIAAAIILAMMALGAVIVRGITKPLGRLGANMADLAEGKYDIDIKGHERTDEIGTMVKAVEVFRGNGLKVAHMTEQEIATALRTQAERKHMMSELQQGFGKVVDAATAGDFSMRVPTSFPDPELNVLSESVNHLVDTVDRGISATAEVLGALAQTDLTRRVEGIFEGKFAQLKDDTNLVADKLGEVVSGLRSTSRSLKTATGEILEGANDLSERTTRQAATIEETSATMEELAGQVLDNATRAQEASSNAALVTQTAEEGGEVMLKANQAMDEITTSSGKISNIVGLIDDIAFQTNLLALNASVEAARAGDAGKGFAVVAVEVRRLAQSAAGAASDIKALIQQSGSEVAGGSRLVKDAATKLEAMLAGARKNNDLLTGIAEASRTQAASINEISTAVRQMDEMTQHNAALVEEINASIEQTESQARELDRIVDVFTLDDRPAAVTSRKPAPAAAPAPATGGIKALQAKVKSAAQSYLGRSTTATATAAKEWAEF